MINAFDFMPSLRPNPYHWVAQVRRDLERIMAAGGRVNRWYSTDLLSSAAGAANPLLALYETRDFYLNVPAATYIWAVAVYGNSAVQGHSGAAEPNPIASGNAGLEVEIFDTCTKEAWWRTSQSQAELGEATIADPNAVAVTGGLTEIDLIGDAFGFWLLPKAHLTSDPGVQMIRLTANGLVLPNPGADAAEVGPIDAQVVLWASIIEGVD